MKILIYGAGTIGMTYAYLLSQKYDVDVLIKKERLEKNNKKRTIEIKNIKKSDVYEKYDFIPQYVEDIDKTYDVVLITVNRYQLKNILPILKKNKN